MLTRMLVVLVLIALTAGFCCAQLERGSASQTADIRATVLNARQIGFPRARLDLRINESSDRRIIEVGKVISSENYLWTSAGKIDCTDSRNAGSLAACYLLPGDEIRAKLMTGAGSARLGADWYIHGITRGTGYVPGPSPGGPPSMPLKSNAVNGNLMLSLEADQEAYRSGQLVTISFTLRNTGTSDVTYQFSSGQQYDIEVSQNGRQVWQWSHGMAFIQALTSLTVKPGESKVFKQIWRQKTDQGKAVEAGEYMITAYLTTRGVTRPTVGPARLTIR